MSKANHENRYIHFVWDRCPELVGVVPPLQELLGLEGFGIRCHTDKILWLNKHLALIHGYRALKNSCATARATMNDMKCSVVMGHTHRMGMYYETGAAREWVAVENGHLMDLRWATYVQGVANWQQGFSIINDHGRGIFHSDQAKIVKGRIFYAGVEYNG